MCKLSMPPAQTPRLLSSDFVQLTQKNCIPRDLDCSDNKDIDDDKTPAEPGETVAVKSS